MTQTWAYLGPLGTFTGQAALDLRERAEVEVELLPAPGVSQALGMVRSGAVDAAVVPLENSVEGGVALTSDELIHGEPLLVAAETYVRVTFDLLVRPGTTLADIRRVGSHPHGIAQVRDWLTANLPGAAHVVTASTASAAADVAAGDLDAAAAGPTAGREFGLESLAADIGLTRDAVTRFFLVRKPPCPPPSPTGHDRSSLVLTVQNSPGALAAALAEITGRGVNMVRLESRPTRHRMGDYLFGVDIDGHIADAAVADMIAALVRRRALWRWLGSFPRAIGETPAYPEHATDAAYRQALHQVSLLRQGDVSSGTQLWSDEPTAETNGRE